jgi:hypothetical protein
LSLAAAVVLLVASESSAMTDTESFRKDMSLIIGIPLEETHLDVDRADLAVTVSVSSNDTVYIDAALQRLVSRALQGDTQLARLWITSIRIVYYTNPPTPAPTHPPSTMFVAVKTTPAESPIADWHIIIITVVCIVLVVGGAFTFGKVRKSIKLRKARAEERVLKRHGKEVATELPGTDTLDVEDNLPEFVLPSHKPSPGIHRRDDDNFSDVGDNDSPQPAPKPQVPSIRPIAVEMTPPSEDDEQPSTARRQSATDTIDQEPKTLVGKQDEGKKIPEAVSREDRQDVLEDPPPERRPAPPPDVFILSPLPLETPNSDLCASEGPDPSPIHLGGLKETVTNDGAQVADCRNPTEELGESEV